jgi:hypothetical protein
MNSAFAVGIFVLLLSCVQLVRTRYRKGLSAIPGPFIASFSNLWKLNAVYKGDMPRRNIAIHEKYGPVVRIGPNHVSFASPQGFQTIHGSRQAFAKVDINDTFRCSLSALLTNYLV